MKYRNNPLNIRYNPSNHWIGLVGNNKGFCEFDSLEHGFRAAVIILRRYRQYGKISLYDIISRWAPPGDNNNTGVYVKFVSDFCHISPLREVKESDYYSVMLAMARIEQGYYDRRWEKPLELCLMRLGIDFSNDYESNIQKF